MTKKYAEIRAQIEAIEAETLKRVEALEAEAAKALAAEKGSVVADVRRLIVEYQLTERDLFGARRKRSGPLAAKYRDPASGATWSGRGRAPAWIVGKKRDRFLISPEG
ncbi:H-NS family nucleoid-associated regulatory protein [Pandoraea apista]|uniref:H-NS histone family protein n=1 Tax=Pandoraea apista TaxID=93218 RepID=UPI000658E531|nr:H-NS histone family protein [Pandoraea apista]ALS68358.1 hypothetical protein AT395_24740 [Pandoraea apista]ALS68419.1 hypothetical protein AT395_25090 [Pandoraea apista]CFB60446.1 H-NS histone family protein [Pandoraea apista]